MSDNSENTDFIIVDSEPQGESPKRKKADKSQVVFLIVIALAVVGGILNFVGSKVSEKKPVTSAFRSISHGTNNVTMPGGKDFIGELHIEGVIEEENSTYNQKNLLSALDDLAKNKKNKGIEPKDHFACTVAKKPKEKAKKPAGEFAFKNGDANAGRQN